MSRSIRPRSRPEIGGLVGVAATLLVLLSSNSLGAAGHAPAIVPTVSKLSLFQSHISHVVFLMQENHPFDNLFGVYCPTSGTYCSSTANGVPAGTCVPKNPSNPSLGCQVPYNFTSNFLALPMDLPHDWNTSHQAWNHGAMNGFIPLGGPYAVGHYNATTVPVYYDLAEQYALSDDFYSGALSYSLSNHWYTVASQPPKVSQVFKIGGTTAHVQSVYLNQSNATHTLEDQLVNSSVSWKYYDFALAKYAQAISHTPTGSAFGYWNPLAARSQSYAPTTSTHFVNRSSFFSDAANGTLPNLSWIIPAANASDHPPFNITTGQNWVASVVNALEASPDWNSTVLFVSWDEYGGFYDHVAPPQLDANGDGFRVPLLTIGPWVRQGFIDHSNLSFDSVLHLMEEAFHLHCIGPRDCHALLPLNQFNFGRSSPRAPIGFSGFSGAKYPMPLQSSGLLPPFIALPPRATPGETAPEPLPSSLVGIDWT